MEREQLHRLIDEKKWTLILHEFDRVLSNKDFSDDDLILSTFEKIDREYREKNAQRYYFDLWKIALRSGKIKLAKSYADFILDYLIEYKRIPALKQMITELKDHGLFKSDKKFQIVEVILGKIVPDHLDETDSHEYHPEIWKNQRDALRDYLLSKDSWELDEWKLAYEFILKFHFDKELFIFLTEKTAELKKNESQKKFLDFLNDKKINTDKFTKTSKPSSKEKLINLSTDYDQLAMDVISGAIEPSITEQKRIIFSIDTLSDEEILDKGKEMIIAFGLLGMDQVVVKLSERVIGLTNEVKERASIFFMKAQALYNKGDFYKVVDLVDDVLLREALVDEEVLAFDYIKAESLFKLRKFKQAKEIYEKIKKKNPHYRLVKERLKNFDEIK